MRFTTRPELAGRFGMVASTHWLGTAAGMRMLERGGNAFDAAVAAGLTLQVVEPHLNGLGGDLPAIIWSEREQRVQVLCGQGVTPAGATIAHLRDDLGLAAVPGTGLLAACVPGAFDAWMLMLRDHGTMELEDVFEVAIGFAHDGCPVSPALAGVVAAVEAMFREHWPTSAQTYLGDGVPAPGGVLRNRELAETYRRIVRAGRQGGATREQRIDAARACMRDGFLAEAIDGFCATAAVLDSSGHAHRGLLSGADLARWSATYEEPVTRAYAGATICKTGPWGQGPVLLQTLALLDGFDLDAMGHLSVDYVHTIVECAKLAFADREAWYGDPDAVDVPLDALLSDAYAASRRDLVGAEASGELRPGSPEGRTPRLPSSASPAAVAAPGQGLGEPTRGDTCHIDVVDREGNMVSATPSGGWLQSSPTVPGLGFALGTRAQMCWLEEGLASSLAPGVRPRTTLTPTLALRDGRPWLSCGTPGGDQQDQWTLTFLLSRLRFGLDLQEAIDAPQFDTTHFPSSFAPRASEPRRVEIEGRVGADVIAGLRERGHLVDVQADWSLGRLSAVSRDEDGMLRAAANPRGMQGYAAGR